MDLQQLYTDLILEYNRNKTNKRKVEAPTVHEHGHNPSCGDDIDVEVKVEGGIIKDLAYTGTGCAISQASTAMMAELLQNRTVDEAIRLCKLFLAMIRGDVKDEAALEELEAAYTLKDISQMPVRVKCATLGWHTLEVALEKSLLTWKINKAIKKHLFPLVRASAFLFTRYPNRHKREGRSIFPRCRSVPIYRLS